MLGVVGREMVGTIEGRGGAHVKVVGLHRMEHIIHRFGRRNTYWSRWETRIFIGIVGRIDLEVLIEDATQG